jgi:hypothetical protein
MAEKQSILIFFNMHPSVGLFIESQQPDKQALYADCAAQTGGFSHIGIRDTIFKRNKHELLGGLGPTLIFRRNWHRLADYVPSGFFKGEVSSSWQYKLL